MAAHAHGLGPAGDQHMADMGLGPVQGAGGHLGTFHGHGLRGDSGSAAPGRPADGIDGALDWTYVMSL